MVNGGPDGYMGCGVRRPKHFTYITDLLGPFREIWEYAKEFSGEKMCQSVGILLESTFVQFYGAGMVSSVLQLVSHIYSNKPTCC